jgi:hypothetical protein
MNTNTAIFILAIFFIGTVNNTRLYETNTSLEHSLVENEKTSALAQKVDLSGTASLETQRACNRYTGFRIGRYYSRNSYVKTRTHVYKSIRSGSGKPLRFTRYWRKVMRCV